MGTLLKRKRKDGSIGYTAIIRIKKAGKVIHSETDTFEREAAATAWMKKRETELAKPGALDKPSDPLLADVIDQYNKEKLKEHGKTKTQVLNTIKASKLGRIKCSEIDSPQLVTFVKEIDASPQTRGNYISHLSSIFTVAKPAWGYPLDPQAMDDARVVMRKLGLVSKSKERSRRPAIAELDKLMAHYTIIEAKRKDTIPMRRVMPLSPAKVKAERQHCSLRGEHSAVRTTEGRTDRSSSGDSRCSSCHGRQFRGAGVDLGAVDHRQCGVVVGDARHRGIDHDVLQSNHRAR